MCLYCNDRCHPFNSLEAVRKHMEAKRHCKIHFGDGDDEEEAELEEFYDYSSRSLSSKFIFLFCFLFPNLIYLLFNKIIKFFVLTVTWMRMGNS